MQHMKTLVILAGGKSSRMGQDKVFLKYQRETFLEHLIRKGATVFDQIIIAAGSEAHAAAIQELLSSQPEETAVNRSNLQVIVDHYDSIGPMGGILSAFEETNLSTCAVTAVDLPGADMQVLDTLLDILESAELDIQDQQPAAAMFLSSSGHIEPCAAAYNRCAYALMKAARERRTYGLLRAIAPEHIRRIDAAELKKIRPMLKERNLEKAFQNINSPEDYYNIDL